jgi:hypothetical protein
VDLSLFERVHVMRGGVLKSKEILKNSRKQRLASLHESTDQLPMHVILERVVHFRHRSVKSIFSYIAFY